MLRNFVIRVVINAVALAAAAYFVDGINYGTWVDLLLVGAVFGVVNAIIKPIVALLTCPLVALTLGIFILVINALMLWLTSSVASFLGITFSVAGFWPAFWGAIIVSIVSIILSVFLPGDRRR